LGLLVVACGGAPASTRTTAAAPSSATRVVLASLQKTTSSSFRADMTATEALTATGPNAAALGGMTGSGPVTVVMTMAAENAQRMSMRMTTSVVGRAVDIVSVLYDGTAYTSSDGGATFKVVGTASNLYTEYGSDNALAYLQSVGSASDEGPGTADGVAVERYSATLDSAKVAAMMQSAAASLPSQTQQFLKSIVISDATIQVSIDQQGRVVTESGPIDLSIDLGALMPSQAGTRMSIHDTMDAHFHDYGSAVTVTKPSVAAG
jgi:hypothetical protein